MCREKKKSRSGALRVLDHAITGPERGRGQLSIYFTNAARTTLNKLTYVQGEEKVAVRSSARARSRYDGSRGHGQLYQVHRCPRARTTVISSLMCREKKKSRYGALRVLDHAMTVPEGTDNCKFY
jgi:hypothetical protein